jgi:hypothetical protein
VDMAITIPAAIGFLGPETLRGHSLIPFATLTTMLASTATLPLALVGTDSRCHHLFAVRLSGRFAVVNAVTAESYSCHCYMPPPGSNGPPGSPLRNALMRGMFKVLFNRARRNAYIRNGPGVTLPGA